MPSKTKTRKPKFVDYTAAEIFNLKNRLHDSGINRGLRQFFYGKNTEPPAEKALILISGHFLGWYRTSYSKYYKTELNRTEKDSSMYDWFSMIFSVPYEDLPMYIGSACLMHRVVAAWRLELGK